MTRCKSTSSALGLAVGLVLVFDVPAPAQTAQVSSGEAVARGDSLMRAFRTADALAVFRAGLSAAPDDPTLLWKTARALATLSAETGGEHGDEALLSEAVTLSRRAVQVAPDLSRAHTTLAASLGLHGRLLAHKYRIRKAREVIEIGRQVHAHADRAIELDPHDFAPHMILGIFHRELATVNPVAKAIARTFLGGYPDVSLHQSVTYLRRAVQLAPQDVKARLELAKTYLAMNRKAEARAELHRALSMPARESIDLVEQRKARELLSRIG